jgi:hypothetical protein
VTLLTQTYQTRPGGRYLRSDPFESVKMECGQLIHAAIINKGFRDMLLANPSKSIDAGFCGEKFSFSREEKERISTIRVKTLEEFATQLMSVVEMPVVPEYSVFRKNDYQSL